MTASDRPTRGTRLAGALAHLGVPIYGPFLPLAVFLLSKDPFVRRHANRGFSLQLIVLPIYAALVIPGILTDLPLAYALLWLLAGFLVALPNLVRALVGRDPLPIPPFVVLRSRL